MDQRRPQPDDAAEVFEEHRRNLTGTAYRILGSWTDAEDVVQDVWLRWANRHADVENPGKWLVTVTVRAAVDRLRRLRCAAKPTSARGFRNRSASSRSRCTPPS
jgi:RNA polymerase sigma-70 factor, ECF subfamily